MSELGARTFTPVGTLPEALTERPQWICWKYVPKGNGKPDKRPCSPTGRGLSGWQKNPNQWLTYTDAVAAYNANQNLAGIGFVLTKDTGFIGIDMDDAVCSDTGEVAKWAQDHLNDFAGTYIEVSPSRTGYRAFVLGTLPAGTKNKAGNREIYDSGRWLTVTGKAFADNEITARPEAVQRYLKAMQGGAKNEPPAAPQQATGGVIPAGNRNNALTSIGGFLRRGGLSQAEIEAALQAANTQRCAPPLDLQDVTTIARSVTRYAPAFDVANVPAIELQTVSVADVVSDPSQPPRFVWQDYCPRGVVTLFGAHGGTGKSTIALMLAVAVASGLPLFDVATEQSPVLFASLEDAGSIVRHRLQHICQLWGIDPVRLANNLHIVDGTSNPELYEATQRGAGETTPVYYALKALAKENSAGLIIVDNASDAFGGDEIQRRQVRAFVRALAAIAKDCDAGVMLLAHVDKNTSRNSKADGGEGYSGSTAWHNSARSRLFMVRNENRTLTIEHQKSNFGAMREAIVLNWPEHGLPELMQRNRNDEAANAMLAQADAEKIVPCLQAAVENSQSISSTRAGNYTAWHLLQPYGLTGFDGRQGKARFWRAMDYLYSQGVIANENYKNENRKERTRIILLAHEPEVLAQ